MSTEVERLAHDRAPEPSVVERIAERVTPTSTRVVFSEPVSREGVTVIGVAKARWGFGGGGGRNNMGRRRIGGGASATPLGFISIKDGDAKFVRIKKPGELVWIVPLILAGGFNVWLVLRGVRALFR